MALPDVKFVACRPNRLQQRGLAAGPRTDTSSRPWPCAKKSRQSLAMQAVGPFLGGRAPYKSNICPKLSLFAAAGINRLFQRKFRKLPNPLDGAVGTRIQLDPSLNGGLQRSCCHSRPIESSNGKRRQAPASGLQDPQQAGRHPRTLIANFAAGESKVTEARKSELTGRSYRRRIPVRAWGDRHDHRAWTKSAQCRAGRRGSNRMRIHSSQHCSRQPLPLFGPIGLRATYAAGFETRARASASIRPEPITSSP